MLRQDKLYRGQYAVHVKKHSKLGLHKTILRCAVPVISAVMKLPEVWRIDFGKISLSKSPSKRRCRIKVDEARVALVIDDTSRQQEILICARAVHQATTIATTVRDVSTREGFSTTAR